MSESESRESAPRRSGQLKLVFLASLFFGPLAIAWVWYAHVDQWMPEQRGNHGTLISPARPLSDVRLITPDGEGLDLEFFRHHWTLAVFGNENCDPACQQQLYLTRQVRTRLGRESHRVQRLLILPADRSVAGGFEGHGDLAVGVVSDTGAKWLEAFRVAPSDDPVGSLRVYIVDPLGNVMMHFAADAPPEDLYLDLKRLLRISRIG